MKLLGNIEVSGITKVVFYSTGEAWERVEMEDEEPVWVNSVDPDKFRLHQKMINIIDRKIHDPFNYRVWIHGATMNIVPVDQEQ